MGPNRLNRSGRNFGARSFYGVVFMAMVLGLLCGQVNGLALMVNEDQGSRTMVAQRTDAQPDSPIPAATRQMVLVITKDWNAVDGRLWAFKRDSASDKWEPAGAAFPIVVGKNGLAWGLGLHGPMGDGGPQKVEGDKKAPAGVFRLTQAFGYEAQDIVGISDFPYQKVTGHWKCVDDRQSKYYNQLVDDRLVDAVYWDSHEEMKRSDDLYRLGVVVAHNTQPVVPGSGSCIFLHLWRAGGKGTSGCTAMARENMTRLLGWLEAGAQPVLVQLPETEYKRLLRDWKLPTVR